MNARVRNYFASLQRRPHVVAGHVAAVTYDPATGQQLHATVAVGGNTLRVRLDGFAPPLAQGDAVRLEQFGLAASADYRLAGVDAGARANTGAFPILVDGTVLDGVSYAGGDYILGKLDEGNVFIEHQTGRLFHRVGSEVYGIEYTDGSQLFGHASKVGGVWTPDGPNVLVSPTGVWIRNGLTEAIHLLSDGSALFRGELLIGETAGARVMGGTVVDFDGAGQPIVTPTRYGLRLYDANGLPQIALLTGTVDNPNTPAFLVGAENATSYLRWLNGILEARGYMIIDGGQIGGYSITAKRITSANNRVILVNENDVDFAEGLLLISDVEADAGVIAWRKSTGAGDEDDYEGLITTYHDGETRLLLGCSNRRVSYVPGVSSPVARIRLETNNPYAAGFGRRGYLELHSTVEYDAVNEVTDTVVSLDTNADVRVRSLAQIDGAPLAIRNLGYDIWVGGGDFLYSTSQGTAGRLNAAGTGVECVTGGYAMVFQARLPANLAACPVYISEATVYYSTLINNACISLTRVYTVNLAGAPVVEILHETSEKQGLGATGAASYTLETGFYMGDSGPVYIRFELEGVSDYGHVVINGIRLRGITE